MPWVAALDVGTLEDRLRAEAAALRSQVAFLPQFSARARKLGAQAVSGVRLRSRGRCG